LVSSLAAARRSSSTKSSWSTMNGQFIREY
jgi:hypothetical protein